MSLDYRCFSENKDLSTTPNMTGYKIIEFSESKLTFALNFTNPLYVSTYGKPDQLNLKVWIPQLFQAEADGLILDQNYSLVGIPIPALMGSQEDYEQMLQIGVGASSSLLMSLIIPFIFMIFASVSMNRVWALYN
jgi:hypothetical protein